MRRLGKSVLAILALLIAASAAAQDVVAPLPKAPIPYSKIAPKAAPALTEPLK